MLYKNKPLKKFRNPQWDARVLLMRFHVDRVSHVRGRAAFEPIKCFALLNLRNGQQRHPNRVGLDGVFFFCSNGLDGVLPEKKLLINNNAT